jgi:hypothetical protein
MQLHPKQTAWLLDTDGNEVAKLTIDFVMRDSPRSGDATSNRRLVIYCLVDEDTEIVAQSFGVVRLEQKE